MEPGKRRVTWDSSRHDNVHRMLSSPRVIRNFLIVLVQCNNSAVHSHLTPILAASSSNYYCSSSTVVGGVFVWCTVVHVTPTRGIYCVLPTAMLPVAAYVHHQSIKRENQRQHFFHLAGEPVHRVYNNPCPCVTPCLAASGCLVDSYGHHGFPRVVLVAFLPKNQPKAPRAQCTEDRRDRHRRWVGVSRPRGRRCGGSEWCLHHHGAGKWGLEDLSVYQADSAHRRLLWGQYDGKYGIAAQDDEHTSSAPTGVSCNITKLFSWAWRLELSPPECVSYFSVKFKKAKHFAVQSFSTSKTHRT